MATGETSPFNTTQGTVYMVLGGGGTDKRDNTYISGTANVTTFTQIRVGGASPDNDYRRRDQAPARRQRALHLVGQD